MRAVSTLANQSHFSFSTAWHSVAKMVSKCLACSINMAGAISTFLSSVVSLFPRNYPGFDCSVISPFILLVRYLKSLFLVDFNTRLSISLMGRDGCLLFFSTYFENGLRYFCFSFTLRSN